MEGGSSVVDLRGATVLVCDDVQSMRDTARQILLKRLPGLEVLTARDGVEALEIAGAQRVDGVVTDFHMPRMNGVALALRLHRERPDLGIALMTAYTDLPLTPEAFGAVGVDVLLRKPFDPIALCQVARYLVRTPAATRAKVRASQALYVPGVEEGGVAEAPAIKWCPVNHPNPPPSRFCSMCGRPLSDLPLSRDYHPRDVELSHALEFGQTLTDPSDAAAYALGVARMRGRRGVPLDDPRGRTRQPLA